MSVVGGVYATYSVISNFIKSRQNLSFELGTYSMTGNFLANISLKIINQSRTPINILAIRAKYTKSGEPIRISQDETFVVLHTTSSDYKFPIFTTQFPVHLDGNYSINVIAQVMDDNNQMDFNKIEFLEVLTDRRKFKVYPLKRTIARQRLPELFP